MALFRSAPELRKQPFSFCFWVSQIKASWMCFSSMKMWGRAWAKDLRTKAVSLKVIEGTKTSWVGPWVSIRGHRAHITSSPPPFQTPQWPSTREHWGVRGHEKQKRKASGTEVLPGISNLPITWPKGAVRTIPVFVLQLPLIPWHGERNNISVAAVVFKKPSKGNVADIWNTVCPLTNGTSVSCAPQYYKRSSGKSQLWVSLFLCSSSHQKHLETGYLWSLLLSAQDFMRRGNASQTSQRRTD